MILQTIHFKILGLFIICMLLSFANGQSNSSNSTTSSTTSSTTATTTSATTATTTSATTTTTTTVTTATNATTSTGVSTKAQSMIGPISIAGSLLLSFLILYT